jgi:hypothetical protein
MLAEDMMGSVIEYTWAHLEHHLDSVRHNTKDFLNNIIRYGITRHILLSIILLIELVGLQYFKKY